MYYEINVTRLVNWRSTHWFATHERSIRSLDEAVALANALREMPGVHEVTCTKWENTGTQISL